MEKIIAAIDGLKFSESTRDYAISLAKKANAHLVGIFLDDFTYNSYKIYDLIAKDGVSETRLKKFRQKDAATRKKSAENFVTACRDAGITYSIHHDKSIALQELLQESIYSDLLIIDSKETFTHYDEEPPTRFVRELLVNVQCPVLVVPPKYKPIKKIVLLYDGEPSSVYAIKMFGYLFPGFKDESTEVISVNDNFQSLHLSNNKLVKEYMKRHYPKASFTVLKGMAETEIVRYLKNLKENCLVVSGAYRRGMVSRWFRQSMADVLMKELKQPLFIAHNK